MRLRKRKIISRLEKKLKSSSATDNNLHIGNLIELPQRATKVGEFTSFKTRNNLQNLIYIYWKGTALEILFIVV